MSLGRSDADLLGYPLWQAIDLVSLSTGKMKKCYGLIFAVKYGDGTGDYSRTPKDSFWWYKNVIESNGEKLD